MQCKEVVVVLEQEGWTPLPEAAREHVAGCGNCQSLVEDLTEIVATAHLLPAEVEPPARVWLSLKAQLEQEGIIKSPEAIASKASFWAGFQDLFRSRGLATAAVGLRGSRRSPRSCRIRLRLKSKPIIFTTTLRLP